MKTTRVYLSGLLGKKYLDYAIAWHKQAEEYFEEYDMKTVSPLRGKTKERCLAHDFEINEIVDSDIADILSCDIVLANMCLLMDGNPDAVGEMTAQGNCFFEVANKFTFGTPAELAIAWWNHKPIVLCTNVAEIENHYWVRKLCTKITPNLETAMKYTVEWFNNWHDTYPVAKK